MAKRRALIPLDELRRWARVSKEEGVSIHGHLAGDGTVTIELHPALPAIDPQPDDFTERLARYARG